MDVLLKQFAAITEAATFIRETWITSMLDALAAGEPVPVEGVSGVWNRAGVLVEVIVYRPLEASNGC